MEHHVSGETLDADEPQARHCKVNTLGSFERANVVLPPPQSPFTGDQMGQLRI